MRRLSLLLVLLAPLALGAAPAIPGEFVLCDLEHTTEAGDCRRAELDRTLRMNDIQVIGTHNSYKQAISPPEFAGLTAAAPQVAVTLDYSHPPLGEQLDAGARQLELDLLYDPDGGRYADPLGRRLALKQGATLPPWDDAPYRAKGLKVLHVQDIDYRSNCPRFADCLAQIRAWSKAHPDHLPILILINLKEDALPTPGTVKPLLFNGEAMDSIDAEIRAVFSKDELVTPDQVRGRAATLAAAIRPDKGGSRGWPRLAQARGKVFFALDAPKDQVDRYRAGRRNLEGRVMFVNAEPGDADAAYITLNDPVADADAIKAALAAGLIVRTRADADTLEARKGDVFRREAALGSGAQYVSTDYLRPDPRFGDYRVELPEGIVGWTR
ncbi:hypothetical protein QO010_000165 [Caulobacter ginsengisoli]|uniref:Calcium-dependent phosphoinositide phospholipase C n=1 Tax=Caulobacter ginsengisoli TaxID=400775 RepID=A0ABU0IK76_9CAUL|nr:phosphatidylinositol-specific phospholipase C1-like protein [Caulobacter ginsengisoli]MDQ0462417.1 hypothetical protein [Caulobacter ginsengisoli]